MWAEELRELAVAVTSFHPKCPKSITHARRKTTFMEGLSWLDCIVRSVG